MRRIYQLKDEAKEKEACIDKIAAYRAEQVKDVKKRYRQRKALKRMEGK